MGCDGSGCPPPTWDDFRAHSSGGVVLWVVLTIAGVLASSLRHKWDVERTSEFLNPFVKWFTEDKYYLLVQGLGCVWICAHYVQYVQDDKVESYNKMVEVYALTGLHILEVLLLCIYSCAQSQEQFMSLAFGRLFIDCLLVATLFLRGTVGDSYFSFSFVAAIRLKILWTEYEGTMDPFRKGIKVKIFHVAVAISTVIFTSAALFYNLETFTGQQPSLFNEKAWMSWDETSDPKEVWTVSASLYAVLCTISTVGYGDVQPRTILGQIMLTLIIVVGLGMSFLTIVGLLEGIQHSRSGGGEYHIHSKTRRRRHIVVIGTPSAQSLKEFLLEIYHPDHESASEGLDVVIMLLPGQTMVMESLLRFLHDKDNSQYLSRVWLLTGSPLDRKDLGRTQLRQASMGYILPNIQSADSEREDIENTMRALSMHRHAPYVRLVALLMKVEFKALMASVGLERKDIACVDEMKLGIMGKACVSQGFATMVCNLFKSAGDYSPQEGEENWVAHYSRGMGNEIYEARLSPAYRGAPFGEVALDVLERSEFKAYMIGVVEDSRYPGEEPFIRIHPGRYFKIGTDEEYVIRGVFIAPDIECIQQHTPDKPFAWKIDKDVGDKSGSMGGGGGLPGQPHENAVPEMEQRWLPNKKQIKRDLKKETSDFMMTTALQRTVQGLKNGASLRLTDVEEVIERKVPMKLWADADANAIEDEAQMATDPRQKAMLQQQLRAAQAQHKEKQQVLAEANVQREKRMRKHADHICKAVAAEPNMRDDPRKDDDQDLDDLLWGGPQTPRRAKWGNALEPPTTVLVRGEHLVVIALEGNDEDVDNEPECHEVEPAGRRIGLEYFMASVRAEVPEYAQRAVVVLAQRVPYDWPKVSAMFKDLYLITGRPLSEENIKLAGIGNAKAIVIYQPGPVRSHDPTLVDAQVIFGTTLTESLLERDGKDVMVLADLCLDVNHSYIKHGEKKAVGYNPDELTAKEARKILEKEEEHYMKSKRFVGGQLFASSNAITSLVANMMYNSALGFLVQELLRSRFVTIPMPKMPAFNGTTFKQLFTYLLRKRNLVAVGLLRRFDDETNEDAEEDEEDIKKRMAEDSKRYKADDPPSGRYIYTMPEGDRLISVSDGIICLAPKDDPLAYLF